MTDIGECRKTIRTEEGDLEIYSLKELEAKGIIKDLSKMPYSIKVLVESMLRQRDGNVITDEDVLTTASWNPEKNTDRDIPWIPARVLLQDLTGGAAITDLASMRNAVESMGKDPELINPMIPVDLVIDHSVNTDYAGRDDAQELNEQLDFQRNKERYALFKWAQKSLKNFRAVPPGNGICHQVNLEYLSPLVHVKDKDGMKIAYPDSCFGTDSHTTQIDGLGVVGWGVGGIEAEAVMVGQPSYMKLPDVIGFKLIGKLGPGITATDLVLTVVQMLRKKGVVGKFVEFYGPGYKNLDLADRATIANMGPEYGATMGFFPVDEKTIEYLRLSGRDEKHIDTVEKYMKEQTMWYEGEPEYTDTLELDLSTVQPCLAGHKRPQDRILLSEMKEKFAETLDALGVKEQRKPFSDQLGDGSLVIASITSCTNTANPSVMIAAGLVAKKAAELGLKPKEYVKTSLAPGSRVVTEYLKNSGLLPYMEKLGFQVCGYGCMTCIGNSGPLSDKVSNSIKANDLAVAPSHPATGTSRDVSTPSSKRTISHPHPSSWRSPSPEGSTSTWTRSLSLSWMARRSSSRTSGPPTRRFRRSPTNTSPGRPTSRSTTTSSRAPPDGMLYSAATLPCSTGMRSPHTSGTLRSSMRYSRSPRSRASRGQGSWPSWETPSPPITYPLQEHSRPIPMPEGTSCPRV